MEKNYEASGYVLKIGSPAPDIVRIKDFIRWYIGSAQDQGRLSSGKKLTVRTICAFAERFRCGFEKATTEMSLPKALKRRCSPDPATVGYRPSG